MWLHEGVTGGAMLFHQSAAARLMLEVSGVLRGGFQVLHTGCVMSAWVPIGAHRVY
jgi:hypothetical protein